MKVIGITGGIGSGKSTIARVFHSFGIPVFDSDAVAKKAYVSHPQIVRRIEQELNITIQKSAGLEFKNLSEAIFSNEEAKSFVESLIHPLVRQDFIQWKNRQQAPYVLFESALLLTTGSYEMCDSTIEIIASEQIRKSRILKRNTWSLMEIERRMKSQSDRPMNKRKPTFTLNNNDHSPVLKEISELHYLFLGE